MSDCTVCFNDYHCLYWINTFKIDGSTMRTHSLRGQKLTDVRHYSAQNIRLGGGGGGSQWKKNLDSIHFQHINPFVLFTFWEREGGGGSEKVYVLYTQLNVDNYGWPLTHWPTFCYYIMPGILKIIDLKCSMRGQLEAISHFFSGHVIPNHMNISCLFPVYLYACKTFTLHCFFVNVTVFRYQLLVLLMWNV